MQFETKFAIVVAEELPVWQKLNVVSFLSGGVTASEKVSLGHHYYDASGNQYLPLCVQPIIVLKSAQAKLSTILQRANRAGIDSALFIEDMFSSGYDEANRATVARYMDAELPLVGVAVYGDKKQIDKIMKGAKLHD